MSVLVVLEHQDGKFKKTAQELLCYGKQTADAMSASCSALVLGASSDLTSVSKFGAEKIYHLNDAGLDQFDSQVYTSAISQVANNIGATTVIVLHSANGKSLVGRLAVKLQAGVVSAVNSVPQSNGTELSVNRTVFSGKAIATFAISGQNKVISMMGNSIPVEESGTESAIENITVDIQESKTRRIELSKVEGTTPLPEAELVVSAGRGMKGPENWQIIEDLADALGATTACSRPVADTGWRPHHEHVGQTGVAIKPNLYIAAGISGAIQHLAGVNNSKTIVVINKDAEAPFFKAADYGIHADLFDVVPRLTEAIKKFKANQ